MKKDSSENAARAWTRYLAGLVFGFAVAFAVTWGYIQIRTQLTEAPAKPPPVMTLHLEKGVKDVVVKAGATMLQPPPVLKVIVNRRTAGRRYIFDRGVKEYHFPVMVEGGTVEVMAVSQPDLIWWRGAFRSFDHPIDIVSIEPRELAPERLWDKGRVRESAARNRRRVFMLGIDGATWDVIFELVNQGRMPAFASLLPRSSYGNLNTLHNYMKASPALWTTIATGRMPDEHGILGFTEQRSDGLMHLYSRLDRDVPAVWNILSSYGRRSGVVGYWFCDPAEEINGIIAGQNFALGSETAVFPRSLAKPLAEYLSRWTDEFIIEEMKKSIRDFPENELEKFYLLSSPSYQENLKLKNYFQIFKTDFHLLQVAKKLLSEGDWDFFTLYLRGTDIAGHFAWQDSRLFETDSQLDSIAAHQDEPDPSMDNFYIWADTALAEILKFIDLDRDTLLIVSDHGMGSTSSQKRFDLNFILQELGLLQLNQGAPDDSKSIACDRTISSYIQKKVTLIEPGREWLRKDEFMNRAQEVKKALAGVTYDAGKPIFENIKVETPEGDTVSLEKAALIAAFDPEAFDAKTVEIRGREYPASLVVGRFAWTGDHRPEGIILMAGDGVKPGGIISRADLLDVAPTILALLGLPPSIEMPGSPLWEAIEQDEQTLPKDVWHASYDYTYTGQGDEQPPSQGIQEKMKDQLESIGYLK